MVAFSGFTFENAAKAKYFSYSGSGRIGL